MSSLRFDYRLPSRPGYESMAAGRDGQRDEHPDEEAHRRFEALLHDRPAQESPVLPLPFSLAGMTLPTEEGAECHAHGAGELGTSRAASQAADPGMPMPFSLAALSAGKPLHLRLTNGPFAGMEIHAAMRGTALALRMTLADRRRFERFAGQREKLASVLEAIFECPICLEVEHAIATPR